MAIPANSAIWHLCVCVCVCVCVFWRSRKWVNPRPNAPPSLPKPTRKCPHPTPQCKQTEPPVARSGRTVRPTLQSTVLSTGVRGEPEYHKCCEPRLRAELEALDRTIEKRHDGPWTGHVDPAPSRHPPPALPPSPLHPSTPPPLLFLPRRNSSQFPSTCESIPRLFGAVSTRAWRPR